jgi:hypothetical protein
MSQELSSIYDGSTSRSGYRAALCTQKGAQLRGLLHDYVTRSTKELDEAVERGAKIVDNTLEAGHEFVEQGKETLKLREMDWPRQEETRSMK